MTNNRNSYAAKPLQPKGFRSVGMHQKRLADHE
jgi:hypothetical protein